jgi:hypothetical protein
MYQRETFKFNSIAPDLIPQDAPAEVWNSGVNVAFHNGETRRVPGDLPTLPGAQLNPRAMIYSGRYWVYCTNTGIYAHDGAVEYDITPAGGWTGDEFALFTACGLSGIVYINASDRDPVYWAGDILSPCALLPDWPADGRCNALRAHKSFLFAIGFISEGGQRVRWSSAVEPGGVPQFWTPAPDNLAGSLDLNPLFSPALDGVTLRDSFLIYKGESIWTFDFVGGNAVFQARKLFAEAGLVNVNAVCAGVDDRHIFVGSDGDVYQTDGVQVVSILDGRAGRTFYEDFTENKAGLYSAVTLARQKQALIAYPQAGETLGTRGLIFDFTSNAIGFRDMPNVTCAGEGALLSDVSSINSWDGDPEAWDTDPSRWTFAVPAASLDDVIVGGGTGFACITDANTKDFLGGEVVASVEKGGIAFGDPQRRKLVKAIWPKFDGAEGDVIIFRLGGQEITGGAITLSAPVPFVIGQNGPVETFAQGRYLFMQIESTGGSPWALGSMDIVYRQTGAW